jgi:hypothetical protein
MAYFGLWPLFSFGNPGSLWESGSILSLNSIANRWSGLNSKCVSSVVHGIVSKCAPAREEDARGAKQALRRIFGKRIKRRTEPMLIDERLIVVI